MMKYICVLLISGLFSVVSFAQTDIYEFIDPQQATEFHELLKELRCLVCQNQDLSDSHAPFAKDMRAEIYRMMQEGKTKKEVVDHLATRYGDFILYATPWQANTYLLWIGPFVLLAMGLLSLFIFLWRQQPVLNAPE